MKKILLVTLLVICFIALVPLCLGGESLGDLILGDRYQGGDDVLSVFEGIVSWFDSFGAFFRSTFKYIRDFGLTVVSAWESVEVWFTEKITAVIEGFNNILHFFGINGDVDIGGSRE